MDESDEQSNTDILKILNICFENERKDRIESEVDTVIRNYLTAPVNRGEEPLTNAFSIFSNYLRIIMRKKLINPNYVLSSVIKWTKNYVGLFMIGMVIKEGANPNIYFTFPGRGNLHVLVWASVVKGPSDPIYLYIATVLRMLGSDIYRPAIRFEGNSSDMDVRLIEQSFEDMDTDESEFYRAGLNVKDYVARNSYALEESVNPFLNSMEDQWLLDVLIATDDVARFNSLTDKDARKNEWEFISSVLDNRISLTRFIIDLSTASAENIIATMDDKRYPLLTETINGQTIPLFAATASCDRDMFNLFIKKGSSIKYVTINTIISFYKIFKNNKVKLFDSCFHMLNDAVKIGADIDLFQFNFFTSLADYGEIEKIRTSYEVPKWKKLCSVKKSIDSRPALRQIAFSLNLDYSMDDEKICNQLERIASMGTDQYLESAIRRQEERIALDVEAPTNFVKSGNYEDVSNSVVGKIRPRCDPKSMVLSNPYAYNDGSLAWLKDPDDGKLYCFPSSTFKMLVSTKVNFYTGKKLPIKFLSTIKTMLSTLREIGVVDNNQDIKDSLKEIYSRSKIDNKKTDHQYETIMEILSHYGVTRERFESLRSETLRDTILADICDVNLVNFNVLPMALKQRTTTRILYSLAKNDTPFSREEGKIDEKDLFISISRAIAGDAPGLMEYLDRMEEPEEEEEGESLEEEEKMRKEFAEIMGKNY